jgi:hypothetical protein
MPEATRIDDADGRSCPHRHLGAGLLLGVELGLVREGRVHVVGPPESLRGEVVLLGVGLESGHGLTDPAGERAGIAEGRP